MIIEPSMSTTLKSQIKQQIQELSVQMNILLTNDIYSLRKNFLELSSNTPESIDGKKQSYFEHREYIHKKSLDLFDSINKHEKIPEASSFERGIIMYALQSAHKSSSLYSKSMEDRVRELKRFKKLEEKAIECMRGTNENLYTQTNLVAFLTTLCTLINQDKYKDDYRMASNADMYNTLLLGETNRLIEMINRRHF